MTVETNQAICSWARMVLRFVTRLCCERLSLLVCLLRVSLQSLFVCHRTAEHEFQLLSFSRLGERIDSFFQVFGWHEDTGP